MLVNCPECSHTVSTIAESCPNCGYPMLTKPKTKKRHHTVRRKRLPNGFGQIKEIKNKRLRKPFRAMRLPYHSPHDCRVRFITAAKESGIDEYAIKMIVGHAIQDITERIYTKRDPSWLLSEIEKK